MSLLNDCCELLKEKFLKTKFVKEEEIQNYGLINREKNLYQKMSDKTFAEYSSGGGGELKDGKMNMIRSSSAMIYNLLGNGDVVFSKDYYFREDSYIPKGLYKKEFEKRYKTVNVKVKGKQVEANLDAWLYNDVCEIFIEAKCLEWIQNSSEKELAKSYVKDTTKYFYPKLAESFRETGENISFSQYDSCQMFKHTLAIYNYLKDKNVKNKKIYLVNLVWEPEITEFSLRKTQDDYKKRLKLEHEEFDTFRDKMDQIIQKISEDTENKFDIIYMSVKNFYSIVSYTDEEQKKFVQRYL